MLLRKHETLLRNFQESTHFQIVLWTIQKFYNANTTYFRNFDCDIFLGNVHSGIVFFHFLKFMELFYFITVAMAQFIVFQNLYEYDCIILHLEHLVFFLKLEISLVNGGRRKNILINFNVFV